MTIFTSEISIYNGKVTDNTNELLYKGQILVQDNIAEGIISDQIGNNYFIFGNFIKFDDIDLYLSINNIIFRFTGRKGLYTYNGTYTKSIDNEIIEEGNFYLKELGLNFDPRECDSENPNPIILFKEKLELFKQKYFSIPNNQIKINEYHNINKKR